MIGDFDIESAVAMILSTGKVVETETLAAEHGALIAGEAHAVIDGDAGPGATVRGEQGLLVRGSIQGLARMPCRVEVKGDVVITGRAENSNIVGRSIRIGRDARACRLTALEGVEIGDDASDLTISVGEFEEERIKVENLKARISQANLDRDYADRQVRLEERRMDRALETTKVALDFTLGQIIQRRRNRVALDLAPFYRMVGEKGEAEMEAALLEFFSRGVIGLLTRTNRDYIGKNPNRQKIFLGVIRNLRELFSLTLKLDQQTARMARESENHRQALEALESRTGAVYVRGTLTPRADVQLVRADVKRPEEQEPIILKETARLTLEPGANPEEVAAILTAVNGAESVLTSNPGEWRGVKLSLQEGSVVREPLEAIPEDAAA
jgi:hypothetical protein